MTSSLDEIYSAEPPSEEAFYRIVDESGPLLSPEILSEIAGTLGLSADSLIVDAGCGKGHHGLALAEPGGSRLLAFDLVPRNYRMSAELLGQSGLADRALAIAARIEAIPLPDGSADLILARDMLNHIADLPAVLVECRRVLREGGHMLVFTVFATDRLHPDEAAEIFRPLAIQPPTMNRDWFESSAVSAGLEIERREVIGSQWREWGEQNDIGRTSRQLLRLARLRRREAEIVAQVGRREYEIELADCRWGVYQMLGKLEPVVYLLRAADKPASKTAAQSVTSIDELRRWVQNHRQSPEDYVISTFVDHDVVLLAEDHAIKHNLQMAKALIPQLHAANVFMLGMEFGASEDQAALDALVGVTGSADYDEALARRLMFNYNTGWAYREYTDLYRAAWEFNRLRPSGTRPFRLLNLSYRYDWTAAGPDRTPDNTRLVFPQGGTEAFRAAIIQQEALDRSEKILVLTGTIHAFTRYAPPVFDFLAPDFVRLEHGYLGQLLYNRAPERVFTILLHQPFAHRLNGAAELVYPAGGVIDEVMAGFTDQRVGFNLVGTPFGRLSDDSYYATGSQDFRLSDLADGYIYEKSFDQFEGCTVDELFVTAENWPEAQANFPDPKWHKRPENMAEYWAIVRDYVDIARRYGRLEKRPAAISRP